MNGWTPLHYAAKDGYSAMCELIINEVNDKNPKSESGLTPLHFAARNGQLSVCQLIINNVQDKNPKDKTGWTPLHYAARNGHFSVCEFIIGKIDDANTSNSSGGLKDISTPDFSTSNFNPGPFPRLFNHELFNVSNFCGLFRKSKL